MSDIVTRCPACNTAFRAEPSQLSAASGLVRCGNCLKVFDAKECEEKTTSDDINIDYLPYVLDGLDDMSNQVEQQLNGALNEKLEQEISREIIDSALADSAENHSKFADMLDDLLDDRVPDQVDIPNPFRRDEAEVIERKPNRRALVIVSALLLGSLAALILWVYVNSETLSAKASYRSALTVFCDYAQCPIAEQPSHSQIQIYDFTVHTNPQYPDQISINFLMVNLGIDIEPMPKLAIIFSDHNHQLLTQHIITPAEYLQDKPDQQPLLKVNQEIAVNMQLPNPNSAATKASIQIRDHR